MDVTSSLRSLLPYGRRSIGISQLIAKLEGYLPPAPPPELMPEPEFMGEFRAPQIGLGD